MTSRETTGLLTLAEAPVRRSVFEQSSDLAWRMAFGAIGWPWLLRSLSGGRKADKRRLLASLGLAPDALPHLGSWKADTAFLNHIVETIARTRPAVVVELGAGASTLVTARALERHGGGRLISFDQHAGFVTATRDWLAENGLSADLRHAPVNAGIEGWPGRWYDLSDLPASIDLLIIDGPPWTIHPLVRGAAESLFSRLSPGGHILLDDAARPGERLVARRWRRAWPDIAFRRAGDGAKGTLIGVRRGARALPVAANDADRPRRWMAAAAGLVALATTGWFAANGVGLDQSFVDEAASSYQASIEKQAVASPALRPPRDAAIARRAGVTLPPLPRGWRVRDVRLHAARSGPAVSLSLTTPAGEAVSLYADNVETPAGARPLLAHRAGTTVAYWEEGGMAFAIAGALAGDRALELAATIINGRA